MGMPKVDIDSMYEEIEKVDPNAITEYGIAMNKKTLDIMEKQGYFQREEDRKEAIKFNHEILKRFKNFLKERKDKEEVYSDIEFYSDCNKSSGHALKFSEMDEEHFNYILFNRAIRKVWDMKLKEYWGIMNSLKVFGEFLEKEGFENSKIFFNVASQKEKMKKRLDEYKKLNDLIEKEKITEEEYGEKMEELFGYGYLE